MTNLFHNRLMFCIWLWTTIIVFTLLSGCGSNTVYDCYYRGYNGHLYVLPNCPPQH